jgi:CheY-like chemotaxis protein
MAGINSRCRHPPILALHLKITKEQGVRPNGTPHSVLVVEDEWLVRDMIVRELRSAGWEVLEASTAEDAITYAQTGDRVDVVFTDIQLGGDLTGWDVADAFRAVRANARVIYTSGNSVDRSRQVARSIFFEKPYLATEVVYACGRVEGWN